MKKFKSIFSKVFFTAALLSATAGNSFAQDQSNPNGIPTPQRPLVNISGSLNTISTTLTSMYNNMMSMSAKLNYATDAFLSLLIGSTTTLNSAQAATEEATSYNLINLIKYYLTGIDVKKQQTAILNNPTAAPADIPSTGLYRDIVFNKSIKVPSPNDMQNVINVDALIGALQYSSDQQTNAQSFIGMVESLSPPPTVIDITDTRPVTVPYSTDPNQSTTDVPLGKDTITLSNLMTYLTQQKEYKKYLLNSRKTIAARSVFMRTLLNAYQRRVIPDGATTSMAQQEYDDANQIFQGDNYSKATSAAPAATLRDLLIYTAKIHKDLYELRLQNEQMMILQSMSGLQTMSFSAMFSSGNTKKIGQMIYCQAYPTDSHCPPPPTTATTSTTTGTGTAISTTTDQTTTQPTTSTTTTSENPMSQLQSASTQAQQQTPMPSMDITEDSSV